MSHRKLTLVAMVLLTFCMAAVSQAGTVYKVFRGLRQKTSYEPFPAWPQESYVNDLAHLLSAKEKAKIEAALWEAEEHTEVEIAVLTVHSLRDYPGIASKTIDEFTAEAVEMYNVGNPMFKNGILLIIFEEDRTARIALGSRYLHLRKPDTDRILRKIIMPQIQRGKFSAAIVRGVDGIKDEFLGRLFVTPKPWNWSRLFFILGILLIPFVLLVLYSLLTEGTMGWGWEVLEMAGTVLMATAHGIYIAFVGIASPRSGRWWY